MAPVAQGRLDRTPIHVLVIGSMQQHRAAQIEALADVLLSASLGGAETVSTAGLSQQIRVIASDLIRALGMREVLDTADASAVVWVMSSAHTSASAFIARRWRAPVVMVTPHGAVESFVPSERH